MALAVVISPNGIPVSSAPSPYGFPVILASNGFGVPVTPVAAGGRSVFDVGGNLFDSGSSVGPNYRMRAQAGSFVFTGEGMTPITGYTMPAGVGAFALIDPGTTKLTPPAPTSITWSTDPARTHPNMTISNAGLTATMNAGLPGEYVFAMGTGSGRSTGKYCFSALCVATNNNYIGICNLSFPTHGTPAIASNLNHVACGSTVGAFTGASADGSVGGWGDGDTVTMCFDLSASPRVFWIKVNSGFWNGSSGADPATGVGGLNLNNGSYTLLPGPYVPFVGIQIPDCAWTANFAPASPPSGFLPW